MFMFFKNLPKKSSIFLHISKKSTTFAAKLDKPKKQELIKKQ